MSTEPAQQSSLRLRLRAALPTALKNRDKAALAVLRSTLAAIDNAEAVELPAAAGPGALAIERTPVGPGAAEVPRRVLTEAEVERIVRDELAERLVAASEYAQLGRPDQAERLRGEAAVLSSCLADCLAEHSAG